MLKLLFSPEGAVGPQEFQKGAVVLLAINFFGWLSWYGGLGLGVLTAMLSLILIYCWFCLFAKRLRIAGKSPAWFILIFLAFVILMYIVGALVSSLILSPDLIEKVSDLELMMQDPAPDLQAVMSEFTEVMKRLTVVNAVQYVIAGSILAFALNSMLGVKNESRYFD